MERWIKVSDLPDLYQVWCQEFTAGLIIDTSDNRCVSAAPILATRHKFIGKSLKYIQNVCHNRRWTLEKLSQ
jgi:hypothetical protein